MKKEIKELWVDALRSDEYRLRQGKHTLKSIKEDGKESYCCLGVLCELHGKANGVEFELDDEIYTYQDSEFLPPRSVEDWADLDTEEKFETRYGLKTLYECNDLGMSFNEIADLIEENL